MNSSIVTTPNGGFEIAGSGVTGTLSINSGAGAGSMGIISTTNLTTRSDKEVVQEILDRYELNEMLIEHRVQTQELLKLKEENVDFGEVIKENMTKNMARQIAKKISFTKKHEVDTDVHSYRGRCWVFTKEEMINLIKEIKNAG